MVFHLTLRTKVAIVNFWGWEKTHEELRVQSNGRSVLQKLCRIWHYLWIAAAGSTALCWCSLCQAGGFPCCHSVLLKLDQMHRNEMFGRQVLVKPSGKAEMDDPKKAEKKRGKPLSAKISWNNKEKSCPRQHHHDCGAGTSDTDPRSLEIPSQKGHTHPDQKRFWQIKCQRQLLSLFLFQIINYPSFLEEYAQTDLLPPWKSQRDLVFKNLAWRYKKMSNHSDFQNLGVKIATNDQRLHTLRGQTLWAQASWCC